MTDNRTRRPQDYVYTITGHAIYPEEFTHAQVTLYDIAFSLAGIYRYNGHSRISVLRHSMAIHNLLKDYEECTRSATLLHALLHDAPESYLMDVPVPNKRYMRRDWDRANRRADSEISQRFNLDVTEQDRVIVHYYDKLVVEYEMDNPLGTKSISIKTNEEIMHIGMCYPAKRYLNDRQRLFIDRAYQWDLTDSQLIPLYSSLVESLAQANEFQGRQQ